MSEEKDPLDAYDAKHGRPEATPAAPAMSEADLFGTSLNPVRETPLAGTGLREVGK
jgi:hypothetical protein